MNFLVLSIGLFQIFFVLEVITSPIDTTTLKFHFHYKDADSKNQVQVYQFNEFKNILKHQHFHSNRETILYLPGFLQRPESYNRHAIMSSHMRMNKYNAIYFEWREIASGIYYMAVKRVRETAELFSDILLDYYAHSDSNEIDLHLIGYSLGSHLSGLIGNLIIEKSKNAHSLKKIRRITGLDPAGPMFTKTSENHHLNKNDANFVDIIHTDAGRSGAGSSLSEGHADFWPNGGKGNHPRCKDVSKLTFFGIKCSHVYSAELYAESVINPSKFKAFGAKSWEDFGGGKFQGTKTATMGADCNSNASGDYYLTTDEHITFNVSYTSTLRWNLFGYKTPYDDSATTKNFESIIHK